MKKRMLSLLLALTIVCSGALTALAADTTPPLWKQFGYDSEAVFCVQNFDLSAAYDRSIMAPYDESMNLTHEEYLALAALYSEELVRMQNGADYWTERGYESEKQMLTEMNTLNVEAVHRDMAWFSAQDRWAVQLDQLQLLAERRRLGLLCDGVNVQYNGVGIVYAGAQPEYANDATYVPVRATAEAMDAKVGFEDKTQAVTVTKGDVSLMFPLGGKTMTVQAKDDSREVPLPAPVYERAGASYIPVRALGEALGCEVAWDEIQETAILIDPAVMIEKMNTEFTVLNRVLAAQEPNDAEKTYRTALQVAGTITKLDSIGGDKKYPISANITAISQGKSITMDAKIDLGGLVAYLRSKIGAFADVSSLDAVQRAMTGAQLQIILNYDEDTIYVRSAALVELLTSRLPQADAAAAKLAKQFSATAWYKITGVGMKPESGDENMMPGALDMLMGATAQNEMTALLEGKYRSVGALIYAMEPSRAHVRSCEILQSDANSLAAILGDKRFVKNGSTQTLTLDSDKLTSSPQDDIVRAMLADMHADSFKGTLSVAADNSLTCALTLHQKPKYGFGDESLLTVQLAAARRHATVDINYHVQNASKTQLTIQMDEVETTQTETFAPPKGALVIDLQTLIDSWDS